MDNQDVLVKGRLAKLYSSLKGIRGISRIYSIIYKEINLKAGDIFLDIGCGPGEVLQNLYKKYGNKVRFHGVDASGDMIIIAKEKSIKTNIEYKVAYAEDLPFGSESFDFILSSLTVHHIPDEKKDKFVSELNRVLKEGGKALIVDIGRPSNFIGKILSFIMRNHDYCHNNMNLIEDALIRNGLKIISINKQFGYIEHMMISK